jgi:predicted patatin/cPLA2 family phospholipase
MGKYYIGGGTADNFPISVADQEGRNILGIVITGDRPEIDTSNILEYAYELISIPMTHLTNIVLESVSDRCKIIRIKNKIKLKSFEFNVSSTEKLNMFSHGYKKAKKFFLTPPRTPEGITDSYIVDIDDGGTTNKVESDFIV